jgi:hypothetical protein
MFWLLACTLPPEPFLVEPWWSAPSEDTAAPAPEDLGALVILNEVQIDNDSTVMTADGEFSDWVELYNPSSSTLDLGRVTLWDQSDSVGGAGAGSLAPGEHLVLWADGLDEFGHLPFSLSSDGDTLSLAVDGQVIDRIATGPLQGDTVWARYPDGGAWEPSARPTPGGPNGNAPGVDLDPSEHLFGADRILKLQLTIPQDSLDGLRASAYEEQPGAVAFEGALFDPISVRIKGQLGSLRTLDQKTAFKVDLDDYERHRLRGMETLTLNNMVQDPSFVHEYFTYALYRALDIPAPRVGWTELSINGEHWGLYLFLETADDQFLKRWFQDPTGPLFEAAYGVDFYPGDEDSFEYDEGPDPTDRSDLTELIDVLEGTWDDQTLSVVEHHVDMDRFVLLMAVEAVTLHWDGYTTANNYRVYHSPLTDQFTMLPWGTDQTWVDYWYMPYEGNGRLFQFCLAVERCTQAYSDALIEVADTLDALDFGAQIDGLAAWLADAIAADPRKEVSLSQVEAELEATRATFETWPDEIRSRVR